MRKPKKHRPLTDITADLYLAVQQYVEAHKGKIIVIGGIQIQQWPDDTPYKFTVGIKCTGRRPVFGRHP